MVRREFPSSEYYELVTGLCDRLSTPGLDPAAKEEILKQLENILAQRLSFVKARAADPPFQQAIQRPLQFLPVEKGA